MKNQVNTDTIFRRIRSQVGPERTELLAVRKDLVGQLSKVDGLLSILSGNFDASSLPYGGDALDDPRSNGGTVRTNVRPRSLFSLLSGVRHILSEHPAIPAKEVIRLMGVLRPGVTNSSGYATLSALGRAGEVKKKGKNGHSAYMLTSRGVSAHERDVKSGIFKDAPMTVKRGTKPGTETSNPAADGESKTGKIMSYLLSNSAEGLSHKEIHGKFHSPSPALCRLAKQGLVLRKASKATGYFQYYPSAKAINAASKKAE